MNLIFNKVLISIASRASAGTDTRQRTAGYNISIAFFKLLKTFSLKPFIIASHIRQLHLCNTYAGYAPFGSGCSPASPF